MDTGADISVMTPDTTRSFHGTIVPGATGARGINGDALQTYGTTTLQLRITDSKGETRTMSWKFLVADAVEPILFGYDWCEIVCPDPEWATCQWTWPAKWNEIERIPYEELQREFNEGAQVFYLQYDAATCQLRSTNGHTPTTHRVMSLKSDTPPTVPTYLTAYQDVFDNKAAGMVPEHGRLNDHAIDVVEDKEPPYGPLYNLSQTELQVLREYLEDATEKGWIRRSTSPAGAPVLFVPKKDGGLRLCVDYRGLNNVTIKNRHPLPLISETLDRLGGANIFTKLDLKDAYHRIRIKQGDEWKTAFRTRYGHFEYMVMPFGLANAPATFQAYISQALVRLVDTICVIYLDDILIYTTDRARHHDDVITVLERLRAYKLYANLKKCDFDCESVEFLGFTVNTKGVSMERSRVDTITQWPAPKSYHDLQVFLGFANFYRRFIQNYSAVIRPMTDMLKGMQNGRKTGPYEWTTAQHGAFDELKRRFSNQPLLTHYDPALPLLIETDASGFAIGAVLSQQRIIPGMSAHWHPIAYYSRKMIPAETRYETHDGEMLAIVAAFKQWRHYLEGAQAPVTVKTDHESLRSFMTKKELNKRQARWAEKLSAFDFLIEYRAGKSNPADGLSRRPDYESTVDHAEQLLPALQQRFLAAAPPDPPTLDNLLGPLEKKLNDVYTTLFTATSQPTPAAITLPAQYPLTDGAWDHDVHVAAYDSGALALGPYMDHSDPVTDHVGFDTDSSEGETSDSEDLTVPEPSTSDGEEPADSTWGDILERQHWPRAQIAALTSRENAYAPPLEPLVQAIRTAQSVDSFVSEHRHEPRLSRGPADAWQFGTDGLLRHKGRAYVPPDAALRQEILRINHDDPHSSHFGARKTLHLLRRHYHWDSLTADATEYVRTCTMCQRTKVARHLPYGQLASLPLPQGPWQEISMDFITELPPSFMHGSDTARDCLLVIVDRYTKMALYIPTNMTVSSIELADLFLLHVVRHYGVPRGIVSDRGGQFIGKFWSAFCYHLKVHRRLSTSFHPQSDGQTERQNQTIEHYLRCYCNYRQNDWCSKLALAEFTYNNSLHSTTGTTPFRALYGYDPEIGVNPESEPPAAVPEAKLRTDRLLAERGALTLRWQAAIAAQQKHHNKRHLPIVHAVGDMVMLSSRHIRQARPSKKLADRQLGPFRILQIVGRHQQAYKLALPATWGIHPVFHVSLLEPYHHRPGAAIEAEPVEIDAAGDEHYEVEAILADRTRKGGKEYYVRWKDYPPDADSWEPAENVDAPDLIRIHEASLEGAPPEKRRRLRR